MPTFLFLKKKVKILENVIEIWIDNVCDIIYVLRDSRGPMLVN